MQTIHNTSPETLPSYYTPLVKLYVWRLVTWISWIRWAWGPRRRWSCRRWDRGTRWPDSLGASPCWPPCQPGSLERPSPAQTQHILPSNTCIEGINPPELFLKLVLNVKAYVHGNFFLLNLQLINLYSYIVHLMLNCYLHKIC